MFLISIKYMFFVKILFCKRKLLLLKLVHHWSYHLATVTRQIGQYYMTVTASQYEKLKLYYNIELIMLFLH